MFQKKNSKRYRNRFDSLELMEWVGKKLNWPQRWYVHIAIDHIAIDHPYFYHKHYPPYHNQAKQKDLIKTINKRIVKT
jgi:hypothetical protein